MLISNTIGRLIEPLTSRVWEPAEIRARCHARVATFVTRGLGPQDRVFLHHGNTLEFFIDLVAAWNVGACVVPVDSRLSAFELANLAQTAQPKLSIWIEPPSQETYAALSNSGVTVMDGWDQRAPSRTPGSLPRSRLMLDDDAMILFTSGTTGNAKGVVHTHRSLRAQWMNLRHALGIQRFRRTLCLLPTHFGHGLICNCLFPWLFGQDVYVLPAFRADLVASLGTLIDSHQITFLSSVPTVWRLALKTAKPPERGSLRSVFCGSAPLSGALWHSIQQWTGANVVNAYGITETASWLAGTTVTHVTPEDGLIGDAWGGVLAVLKSGDTIPPPDLTEPCRPDEQGYVWVNTPALMKGYFGRDDLTAAVVAQGWFSTGDIGLIDERGVLYLRGRVREEINKAGQKVYPGDVDAVIEQFDATLDVCTFGYIEPLQGEDVGVAMVLRSSGVDTLLRLYRWTASRLAPHQIPRRWYLVEEIPRTPRGKLNRVQIAERCDHLTPLPYTKLLREHDQQ